MSYIVWEDKYNLGIKTIDTQHKKIIDMLNEFYQDIQNKNNVRESLLSTVKGLIEYSEFHLSTEEKLMQRAMYPEFEAHKKVHDEFVKKVRDMHDRLINNRMVLPLEISNFIKDWFLNHILKTDKRYVPFLKEKGIT